MALTATVTTEITAQDFPEGIWRDAAMLAEQGRGLDALLLFVKAHGGKSSDRPYVPAMSTLQNASEKRRNRLNTQY